MRYEADFCKPVPDEGRSTTADGGALVDVGEAVAVVIAGVASWLIGCAGNVGTDAGLTAQAETNGAGVGTDDDLRSVVLGGSSDLTADCRCIFFKLPFEGLPCGFDSNSCICCFGLLL